MGGARGRGDAVRTPRGTRGGRRGPGAGLLRAPGPRGLGPHVPRLDEYRSSVSTGAEPEEPERGPGTIRPGASPSWSSAYDGLVPPPAIADSSKNAVMTGTA